MTQGFVSQNTGQLGNQNVIRNFNSGIMKKQTMKLKDILMEGEKCFSVLKGPILKFDVNYKKNLVTDTNTNFSLFVFFINIM